MMFVCGGAFEGLYDQVYNRVCRAGLRRAASSPKAMKSATAACGIESRFSLADFLKIKDLFEYGMVPQFMARFDKVVVLNDLYTAVLKEILLHCYDSPFPRRIATSRPRHRPRARGHRRGMIAEQAAQENRTGARALRDVFSEIVNPLEFDPAHEAKSGDKGPRRIRIDVDRVKRSFRCQTGSDRGVCSSRAPAAGGGNLLRPTRPGPRLRAQ